MSDPKEYYAAFVAKWATLDGSQDEKLATINSLTEIGASAPVSVVAATNYMRQNGSWYAIKAASMNPAAQGFQAAFAAVDLVQDLRVQTINFELPIVVSMGKMLVDASLMTQEQWNGLIALGATSVPWWQANGYTSVFNENDLEAAELL